MKKKYKEYRFSIYINGIVNLIIEQFDSENVKLRI